MSVPLQNILKASSAGSFRILDISRGLKPEERLFKSQALNNTIIFKQPSFALDGAMPGSSSGAKGAVKTLSRRPIQTAIYVPKSIDGIWDPDSNDATAFIAAFRIEADAIPEVFGAWKGISYYQYQLQRIRPKIAEMLGFLQSDNAIATDARRLIGSERESLAMFRKDIHQRLRNAYKNTQSILLQCDEAYDALIKEGNPLPFRDFLQTAVDKYWTLGACNCSLVLISDVWTRFTGNGRTNKFEAEALKAMFTGMRSALSAENVGNSID
ncbi:MAG: hypothetical protein EXR08_11690 [Alphaproteobacteria bacterium]|nr:hypothetical protein [Alphaproteobacteria bacterium]